MSADEDGTFTYASMHLSIVSREVIQSPTISGTTGVNICSTAGLSSNASTTGEIDLSASTAGTYTVS